MSYQVLARKWRPRTFATLVGQEHVVKALTHALTEGRLHHAYLFTGTRGVGKTTLARILAKSLNCEAGVTAAPCGTCSACVEIDGGRFVDLLEVDAATNTRVDEMRQLLENAVYVPTRGRFKVYVIDEVHMLSNSAFNAMLKTLEEPPAHVKFILATTDPQKIPVTVLSRCLQFNLKQMPPAAVSGHLEKILAAEGVPFEPPALAQIARSAAGSMRDALSLLDQAIAHGGGRVEADAVREMLGTVDLDYLLRLLESLAGGSPSDLLGIAEEMALRSLAFGTALQDLGLLLTRLQMVQFLPSILGDDEPERERLARLAGALSQEFVQLAYQIVLVGRSELVQAPDDFAGFVMTLLRLYAFRPESPRERVLATTAGMRQEIGGPAEAAAGAGRQPLPAAETPANVVLASRDLSEEASRPLEIRACEGEAAASADRGWQELLAGLTLGGMARELAQQCEMRELSPTRCLLRLPSAHRHLLMKPAIDKLQIALGERLGRTITVSVEVGEVKSETPAASAQRAREARQREAMSAIEDDQFVREAMATLDASLVESTIKPLN